MQTVILAGDTTIRERAPCDKLAKDRGTAQWNAWA